MIVTVHNLAKTYKLLPSEVMSRATTFDLYVLDTSTRYIRNQQDAADNKTSPLAKQYSTQELMAMLKKVRSEQ